MSASDSRPPAADSDLGRLERDLAQARLALEDFTYSVSHDLRASLRHVTAYLRIAREDLGDGIDPAVAGHLETAAGAAAQMGVMMDGLLELSRLGQAPLHWGEVDLAALVEEVRERLAEQAQGRSVTWKLAPDLPRVQGDMALLAMLLTRLLDNALKFTARNPAACIGIAWRSAGPGWVEIDVTDDGVGFDPRLQDRLFRVFQRLHSPREFEGQGIGLALARRVVERHGGSIRATGAVGKGCCVSLTLPV